MLRAAPCCSRALVGACFVLGASVLIGARSPQERTWVPVESPDAPSTRESSALCERLERGEELSAAEWRGALLAHGVVRMRKRYAADEEVAVSIDMPDWLGYATLQLVPKRSELREANAGALHRDFCGNASMARRSRDLHQPLGKLPVGRHALDFDVVIHRRQPGRERMSVREANQLPDLLSRTTLRLDVEVVATADELLPRVHGADVDANVRDSLSVKFARIRRNGELVCRPQLWLRPDLTRHPELRGTVLSLHVEILHRSEPKGWLWLFATASDDVLSFAEQSDERFRQRQGLFLDVPAALDGDAAAQREWSLRVNGVDEDVRNAWWGERWFDGSFTIELPALLR